MAVTAHPRDTDGALLTTRVTNATTAYNSINTASNAAKNAAAIALDMAQRDLVIHYLNTGRILAATVLSTLT